MTIRMMMNGSCDVIELVSVLGCRLQCKAYESSEAHTLPSAPVSLPSSPQLAITSHNTSTPERHCSALLSFTQRYVHMCRFVHSIRCNKLAEHRPARAFVYVGAASSIHRPRSQRAHSTPTLAWWNLIGAVHGVLLGTLVKATSRRCSAGVGRHARATATNSFTTVLA